MLASPALYDRISEREVCETRRPRSAVAQERRDVDLVVGDLERRALDARAAIPAAGAVAGLLARGARPGAAVVEAGGDHRHADLVAHVLVDDGAEDDVRRRVGRALDDLRRLVDLEQADVAAARDVQQDAGRALDGLLEQRARDRLLASLGRAVLAARLADAHEGGAGVRHDRPHVSEVEVDEAGDRDEVGDPLDALTQDVVGLAERLEDGRTALDDVEELLVRDDDQRVDDLAQAGDALVGLAHPLRALEVERLRDDAHGERTDLVLRDLGDDGRGARAGAAALTGRDEHHARALERLLDVVARLRRGALADVRIRSGAETLGELRADVQLEVGVRHLARLGVRVGRDELHAGEPGVAHPVHGIGATAADADDLYDCEITAGFHEFPSGPLVRVERFSRLGGGADYRNLRRFRSRCQRA